MRPSKDLIGASTGLLVLSALAREASYGYEIVRKINDAAGGAFSWQEGTIYPLLHRLEKEGLVRSKWQESETGRQRKYYLITSRGRGTLTQEVEQWNVFHAMILGLQGDAHV
jgi:DNA-binding PadR family transcriptional regulator